MSNWHPHDPSAPDYDDDDEAYTDSEDFDYDDEDDCIKSDYEAPLLGWEERANYI
jgi:hypothetical protein